MTHMLSSLAGGKLVVALEVGPLPSFFRPSASQRLETPFDWIITGRIQSPSHLRFRPRRRPCSLGWNPARAGYHASIRSGYRGGLPGRAWTKQVLEMHRCKGLWTSWRYVFFFLFPPPSSFASSFLSTRFKEKKGGNWLWSNVVTELESGTSPVYTIPDLLKIHRAHHMFTKHQLYQIPLASQDLEAAFGGQIICKWVVSPVFSLFLYPPCQGWGWLWLWYANSENMYEVGEKGVLVVFVHDLWVYSFCLCPRKKKGGGKLFW